MMDEKQFHARKCMAMDNIRRRPYRVCTGSFLISEINQRRARPALGWGAAWENLKVLSAFSSTASGVKFLVAAELIHLIYDVICNGFVYCGCTGS